MRAGDSLPLIVMKKLALRKVVTFVAAVALGSACIANDAVARGGGGGYGGGHGGGGFGGGGYGDGHGPVIMMGVAESMHDENSPNLSKVNSIEGYPYPVQALYAWRDSLSTASPRGWSEVRTHD